MMEQVWHRLVLNGRVSFSFVALILVFGATDCMAMTLLIEMV